MKNLYAISVALLLTVTLWAQAPQKMSYQAIIRDENNIIVSNHVVGMQISILQGTATGTPVYVESQNSTTNTNGLITIEIGGGTPITGIFENINWGNGPYFIKTETDPTGGTNYTIVGTSQLLSVPYALHAQATDNGNIIINNSNFTSTPISADNNVVIQGTITLSENYSGLNSNNLVINGGTITGNGFYVLSVGNCCIFNGVTFNAVEIDCSNWATFINCTFTGSCPNIGNDSKFYNCQFSGVATGSNFLLGSVVNSIVSNCTMPHCHEFINSNLSNSIIGYGAVNQCAISNIIGCSILSCSIYALQSDFVFTENRCSQSSVFLNNATQCCNIATIANNQFSSGLSPTISPINIDPTTSNVKMYVIQNNFFAMQSNDDYCIKITSSVNGAPNTNVAIKGNTFWRGANIYPILYQSSIVVDYTGNTVWQLSNPSSTSGLTVSAPNFTH
jgi:hypothetical protein